MIADVTRSPYSAVPGQDCTAAIQSALTDVGEAGGGMVVLPPAAQPYLVDGLVVRHGHLTVFLQEGAVLQRLPDSADDILLDIRANTPPTDIHLLGPGVIDGNASPDQTGLGIGVRVYQVTGFTVEHLTIRHTRHTGLLLTGGNDGVCTDGRLTRVTCEDIGQTDEDSDGVGLRAAPRMQIAQLICRRVKGNGLVVFDGSTHLHLSDAHFADCTAGGLAFDGVNGTRGHLTDALVSQLTIERAGAAGVRMVSGAPEHADLSRCQFHHLNISKTTGQDGAGAAVTISAEIPSKADHLLVSGLVSWGNPGGAHHLHNVRRSQFSGIVEA